MVKIKECEYYNRTKHAPFVEAAKLLLPFLAESLLIDITRSNNQQTGNTTTQTANANMPKMKFSEIKWSGRSNSTTPIDIPKKARPVSPTTVIDGSAESYDGAVSHFNQVSHFKSVLHTNCESFRLIPDCLRSLHVVGILREKTDDACY